MDPMDPLQSNTAEVHDLRAKVDILTKELAEAQEKLAAVQTELKKSEDERKRADDCCTELHKKVEKLNQEIDILRSNGDRSMVNIACQTDLPEHGEPAEGTAAGSAGPSDWVSGEGTAGTVADSVRAVAEAAASETGFVLDQTTGMYYDCNSGYYYDQVSQLYYDPNTGIYYYFDEGTGTYQFHSQVAIAASSSNGKVHYGKGRGGDFAKRKERQADERRVRDERRRENVEDMDCQIIKMGHTTPRHYRRHKKDVSKAGSHRFSKRDAGATSRRDCKERHRRREHHEHLRRDGTEEVEVISNGHEERTRRRHSLEQRRKRHREGRLQRRREESKRHRGHGDQNENRDHVAGFSMNQGDIEMVSDGEVLSDDGARPERQEGEVSQSQVEVCVDKNIGSKTGTAGYRQDQEKCANNDQSPDIVKGGSEGSTAKDDSQSGEEVGSDGSQGSSGDQADNCRNRQVIVKNPDTAVPKTELHVEPAKRTERQDETAREYSDGEVIDDVAIIEDGQELIILSSDEMEDGELSDSLSDVSSSEGSFLAASEESPSSEDDLEEISSAESDNSGGVEVLKVDYPPCIRMIVTKSDTLKPGSLYVITCSGGSIGREGSSHVMLIQSVKVSKRHAQIVYNSEERQYVIIDLGSQNGTLLNGKAISEQRVVSQPHPLSHRDYITIGGTTLRLHIHSGDDTCEECEPGQVQALIAMQQLNDFSTASGSKQDKEQQRRKELHQLKKKYNLSKEGYSNQDPALRNPAYEDRAAERRRVVGSDNPYQPDDQPASVDRAIESTNIGHKMLSKMGWSEGQSLGKGNQGIKEPIQAVVHSRNAGLGSGIVQSMDHVQHSRQRNKNWDKARGRYNLFSTPRQPGTVGDQGKNGPTWVQGTTGRLDPRGRDQDSNKQSGTVKELNVVQLPLRNPENGDGNLSGPTWEIVDIWDESMETSPNAQEEGETHSGNLEDQSVEDDKGDLVTKNTTDGQGTSSGNKGYEEVFLKSDGSRKSSAEGRPSVLQKLDTSSCKQTCAERDSKSRTEQNLEHGKETRTITPADLKKVDKGDLKSVECTSEAMSKNTLGSGGETIPENVGESVEEINRGDEVNIQTDECADKPDEAELPSSQKPFNKYTSSVEVSSKKLEPQSNSKQPTNPADRGKIQLKWARGGKEKVEKLTPNLVAFEESESEEEETTKESVVHSKNGDQGQVKLKQGRGARGGLRRGSKRPSRWSTTKEFPGN